jgi:hypothetical protein
VATEQITVIDGVNIEIVPAAEQLSRSQRALAQYQEKLRDRRSVRIDSERAGRSAEAILHMIDEIHRLERLSAIEAARIEYLTHQIGAAA